MKGSLFKTTIFVALVLGFLGIFLWQRWQSGDGFRVRKTGPAVVTQLQELNRLETASFTIEKVIDASTEHEGISEFLFGDRLLLIAHGQVIAGFDLSSIEDRDVKIEGERLELTLPAPEILITTLDNQATRVYERDQGILASGERDLESEARREAESVIRVAACEGGILEQATENAKEQLSALFKTLGYLEVIITIPEGGC